jgi:hypothetical protein
MSRVRRINVSQLEGNNSNDDNDSEIRPFGEIGVYVNEDGNIDKPELLMFDGVRTHIKSKVLAPGILYGSNGDSGDGAGLDTIKLIPDAALFRGDGIYSNDQYIIVDPTAPNHIHLRAGGTIDDSSADLFLGGEGNHIRVSDGSKSVEIKSTSFSNDESSWRFTAELTGEGNIPAKITFPDNTEQTTAWAGGRVVSAPSFSTGAEGDRAGDLSFANDYIYYCIADYNQLGHQVTIAADYLGRTDLNTNLFQLTKTADTLLITAGDIISDSNGGATSTVVTVTSDENYTYVSTGGLAYAAIFPLTFTSTDYVPGGNIWKRVAWSADTW